MNQAGVYVAAAALRLQGLQLFWTDNACDLCATGNDTLHNDKLIVFTGVVNQHFHHEAVDLSFGQGVGAFGFNRVLGGHH